MECGGFSEFVYKPLVKILTVNQFIALRAISEKKFNVSYYEMVLPYI